MDMSRLEEFIDLAGTLNFSRTARNLGITQSTLSRHIADLESELGERLFDRTSTSVRLTQTGKSFYEKAVSAVDAYRDVFSTVRSASTVVKQTVRVSGSTLQPTANRIVSALSLAASSRGLPFRFAYTAPRSLSNEPVAPFSLDLLRSGKTDLVVDTFPLGEEPPAEFDRVWLCSERLVMLTSPLNHRAHETGLRLEDLRDMTLVSLAVHKHCPQVMAAPFRAAGIDDLRVRTFYIDDVQEISEHLARLQTNEVVFLQQSFVESYGFDGTDFPTRAGVSGATGTNGSSASTERAVVRLDLDDERARLEFWGLVQGREARPHVLRAYELMKELFGDNVHPRSG